MIAGFGQVSGPGFACTKIPRSRPLHCGLEIKGSAELCPPVCEQRILSQTCRPGPAFNTGSINPFGMAPTLHCVILRTATRAWLAPPWLRAVPVVGDCGPVDGRESASPGRRRRRHGGGEGGSSGQGHIQDPGSSPVQQRAGENRASKDLRGSK